MRYAVRQGQPVEVIRAVLAAVHASPAHEFWPDALSYLEADLAHVAGHRQVTDAYLVSLVRQHGPDAKLATFDRALAALHPDAVELL